MVWYKDVPILIVWISLLVLIIIRFRKNIKKELKGLFQPILQNKILIFIVVLNLVLLGAQITIYAIKSSYAGNAAFEPDQCLIVDGTLRMVMNWSFRPHLLSNPPFVFYLMYPIFALIYAINPQTPFSVYLILQRVISLLTGAMLLIVLFNINNLIFKNKKMNLLSLIFISINGLVVSIVQGYGRYIDVIMLFWMTLAIYYCIKSYNEKKIGFFFLSIIFGVFSLSSKLPGILILLFIAFIIFPIYAFTNKLNPKEVAKIFAISFALSIFTFIIANPYFILEPVYTFDGLINQFKLVSDGYLQDKQPISKYFIHYFAYQGVFATIMDFMGYACALVLIGLAVRDFIKKRDIEVGTFTISSLAIGYFAVYPLFFTVYMVRYSLPSVQFTIIALFILIDIIYEIVKDKIAMKQNDEVMNDSSDMLSDQNDNLKKRRTYKMVMKGVSYSSLALLVFIILSFSVVRVTYFNVSYYNDERNIAGEWLTNNIDNDAVILASSYVYVPEEFTNTIVQWGITEARFLEIHPEYLVLSSIQYSRNISYNQSIFYANLFSDQYNVTLLQEFQPNAIPSFSSYDPIIQFRILNYIVRNPDSRYGPTVLIYQVNSV